MAKSRKFCSGVLTTFSFYLVINVFYKELYGPPSQSIGSLGFTIATYNFPGGVQSPCPPPSGSAYDFIPILNILGQKRNTAYKDSKYCVLMRATKCHLLSMLLFLPHSSMCFIKLSQPKPMYWLIFYFPVFHVHINFN